VKCGSFTALLLCNAYPNVVTATVLDTIIGSPTPDSAQWYDAIMLPGPHPVSNGISIVPMDGAAATPTGRTMSYLAQGDILASKYNLDGITGHMMTVGTITVPTQTMTLTGTRVIPGVTSVKRWLVKVYDGTSSVHGTSDSRYGKDPTETNGNDQGIGEGSIYLYEDATTGSATLGRLVGWTWSTASSYTYQFTNLLGVDGSGKTTYRPMVIGRLAGI